MSNTDLPHHVGNDFFALAFFDDKLIISKRMEGNPDPSNNALGAVLMDAHQLAFLKHLLDTLDTPTLREDYRQSLDYYRILFKSMSDVINTIECNPL